MNLGALISMAGSILDYSPDVPSYKAELRRFINEAYLELFADRAWLFSQKTAHLNLWADVTLTGLTITRPAGHLTLQLQDPLAGGLFPIWASGATLEITAQTGSVSTPQEVVVRARVDGDTAILEDKDGRDLGTAFGTATAVTVTFKQRYVDLPRDTVDVLSIALRYPAQEREPFVNLTRWEDEYLLLNMDLQGRPTNFMLADNVQVPAPMLRPVCAVVGGAPNVVPLAGDYDVVYTHIVGDRESAPSPNSDLATFTGTDGLNVTGMQNNGDDDDLALRKQVYFRPEGYEAFYRVENAAVLESVTSLAALGATIPLGFVATQPRLPGNDGIYKRVRMYPRQDEDLVVDCRYMAKPPKLLDDADTPVLPPEFHRYLVHAACAELFVKHGNAPLAQMYRGRAEAGLAKMAKRYLTTKSNMLVKGDFRGSLQLGRPWRTLTHLP